MSVQTRRTTLLIGVAFVLGAIAPSTSWAKSDSAKKRKWVHHIDARKDLQRAKRQYRKAMIGDPDDRFHRAHIILRVSGHRGFDCGYLRLPRRRRFQHVSISIYVYGGHTIRRRLRVNAVTIDGPAAFRLTQQTYLRG